MGDNQKRSKKSLTLSYILWLLGGVFGLHHLYLGRDLHAFLWNVSFGGFGVGWLADAFYMQDYVNEASHDEEFQEVQRVRRKFHPKPSVYSVPRWCLQVSFGAYLGVVLTSLLPGEDTVLSALGDIAQPYNWVVYEVLVLHVCVLATSLGMYLAGNHDDEVVSFRATLWEVYYCALQVMAFSLLAVYSARHSHLVHANWDETSGVQTVLVGSLGALRRLRADHTHWKPSERNRRHCCMRLLRMVLGGALLVLLVVAVLVQRGEFHVTDRSGRTQTVFIRDLFNRDEWLRFAAGWRQTASQFSSWDDVYEWLSDDWESTAYSTLDLQPGASQAQIRRAYKKKILEVHPDKQSGKEAEFIKVQKAYEKLANMT